MSSDTAVSGPALWYSWRRFSPINPREWKFAQNQIKERWRMRLKLVFAAAALAAFVGAGSCIALVLGLFSAKALSTAVIAMLLTLTFFIVASILNARRIQPNLALHRTQSVDDEANVLVEIHA